MLSPRCVTPLHRHQLVRLTALGWQRILAGDWDDEARTCLLHWAAHGLPLVVTRQSRALPGHAIAVGLAAPAQWSRRRIALCVDRSEVLSFDEFPRVEAITEQIPADARDAWIRLCVELRAAGITGRVHGSYGWEQVSRLHHVHCRSDVDLGLSVADAGHATTAVAVLQRFDDEQKRPRLDGELLFADGNAFAWREWQAWRAGCHAHILSKRIGGPLLLDGKGIVLASAEGVAP